MSEMVAQHLPGTPSSSYELLHEGVQRWIWRQGWQELRDIQENSIPVLLQDGCDLIVAAATASGKTEAAFLPIVSRLATEQREPGAGFDAIYVSPLRALINDQFGRIEELCRELEIPVVKWHGDIGAHIKARARQCPGGILLTTPESLEAILCRRGAEARGLFAALSYVVVDELHAFLGAPRGRQLQSLLNRIEIAAGHRVARVGLSATLADMSVAAEFLRPGAGASVHIEQSDSGGGELRLQLRGYLEPAKPQDISPKSGEDDNEQVHDPGGVAEMEIARHLFATLRGKKALVFAGSRQRVESMTAALHGLTEAMGIPEEFVAHHGSLSREFRESAENRMKDRGRPSTAVCTTTLQLGLDIGYIEAVAQLDGHCGSDMRQRLGRSGRRAGQPAVMRAYVREAEIDHKTHPVDALRLKTVENVAMINLMLAKWNEPSHVGQLHLSTLVHQILALIAQHGGLTARQGWDLLCGTGVFSGVDVALYTTLLRRMAHNDVALLEQAPDGTLLPGARGEMIIASSDFYAVFMTPEEFRVVTSTGRNLGSLSVENPLVPNQMIIFAGRRWRVLNLDASRREIVVERAHGGKPPAFGGHGATPHDGVVAEMHRVYRTPGEQFAYLDPVAKDFLHQGQNAYHHFGLDESSALVYGDQIILFPWAGAAAVLALTLAMTSQGLAPTQMGPALCVPQGSRDQTADILLSLATSSPPSGPELATLVADKIRAKYDKYLDQDLLCRDWASECLDVERVPGLARTLLDGLPQNLETD